MGCSPFKVSSSSYDDKMQPSYNPNPKNFKILSYVEEGGFLLLEVLYPDAKNFEGKKLLLFKDLKFDQIKNQTVLDPHFSQNKNFFSPIARFEPTQEGFNLAKLIMELK